MFGGVEHGDAKEDGHGTGILDDPVEFAAAWKAVDAVFGDSKGILYELINEPFGYKDAATYLQEMRQLIGAADLPQVQRSRSSNM